MHVMETTKGTNMKLTGNEMNQAQSDIVTKEQDNSALNKVDLKNKKKMKRQMIPIQIIDKNWENWKDGESDKVTSRIRTNLNKKNLKKNLKKESLD